MRAKVIETNYNGQSWDSITQGNTYHVLGIMGGEFQILSDEGVPDLYPKEIFTVVDNDTEGWIWEDGDGEVFAGPEFLLEPGFIEDVYDIKPEAILKLRSYMAKLCGNFIPYKSDNKTGNQGPEK